MSQSTPPSPESSDEALDFSGDDSDSSEAWLDDVCLEPLASEPGFSRLCNACIRVFRVYPRDKRANHVQYLDTLVRSAQRGCVLCALILHKIERKDPKYHSSRQANITYNVCFPFRDDKILAMHWYSNKFWKGCLRMVPLGNRLYSISFKCTLTYRSFRNAFSLFN